MTPFPRSIKPDQEGWWMKRLYTVPGACFSTGKNIGRAGEKFPLRSKINVRNPGGSCDTRVLLIPGLLCWNARFSLLPRLVSGLMFGAIIKFKKITYIFLHVRRIRNTHLKKYLYNLLPIYPTVYK